MNIDFNKIYEIYDEDLIEALEQNKENVKKNIEYFKVIGFEDFEDIFERVAPLFVNDNEIFKQKINSLVKKIGPDYVYLIENDISILEEII